MALTDNERDTVVDLIRAQSRLADLNARAEAEEGYVGAHLDQANLTVLTIGDPEAMRSRLAPLVPAGGTLEVVRALYSRAELEEARSRILSANVEGIVSIALNESSGRLRVGVLDPDGEGRQLAMQFGEIVELVPDQPASLLACTSRDDCGTIGGSGARAYFNATPVATCTTAFLAKWGSSSVKMLTAGHCIKDAGGLSSSNKWRNYAGTTFWDMNLAMNFCNGCNTDSGLFHLGSAVPADRDQYYLGTGPRDLVGTFIDSALVSGRLVCRSGRVSDFDCGPISFRDMSIDVDKTSATFWIHHSWKADFQSLKGDSGAGMVTFDSDDDLFAAGILFGGSDVAPFKTYFSSIQRVQSYHGITVCTTNSCGVP